MTVELITGKAGTPHISSDDIGAMQAGLVGYGNYLLQAKDGTFPKMTLKDNNHVTVPVMNLILEGRYTRVTAADEVTIQSGTSGQKRNDLICLKYTRDSSQVEKVEWVVLKGTNTTGTPADPSVPSGSIIDGSATAYAKIARVSLNGITASAPVMLATNLPPIGDSVTQMPRIYTGMKDIKFSGAVADLLSDDEYKQIVGRSYTGGDVVMVTTVTQGSHTTLATTVFSGNHAVRVVQTSYPENVTISVRYAIIAAQHSVTQNIVFHKASNVGTSDVLNVYGRVFPNGTDQWIAVVGVDWTNGGGFKTSSWSSVNLATIDGWKSTLETMHACHENVAYEHIGKNAFRVNGNTISYQTPGSIDLGAGSWHKGSLIFPVVPAQHSVTLVKTVQWKPPYASGTVTLQRIGKLCFLNGNVKFDSSGENNYTKANETIPSGFRPTNVNTPIMTLGGSCTFIIYSESSGTVTMLGNPNSAYAGGSGAWITNDPWPQ